MLAIWSSKVQISRDTKEKMLFYVLSLSVCVVCLCAVWWCPSVFWMFYVLCGMCVARAVCTVCVVCCAWVRVGR